MQWLIGLAGGEQFSSDQLLKDLSLSSDMDLHGVEEPFDDDCRRVFSEDFQSAAHCHGQVNSADLVRRFE